MRVTDKVIWGSKRIASLAERLGHMASGQSIRLFERNGFRENGPWRQSATVTNRWRVARLDYILARNATAIPERPVINPVTPSHEGLTVITHRLLFSTIRTAV